MSPTGWRRSISRRKPFDLGRLLLPPLEGGLSKAALAATEPTESIVAELLVDPDGLLTGANDSARQLFGIGPEDMARPLSDLRLAFEPLELASHVGRALLRTHVASGRCGQLRRAGRTRARPRGMGAAASSTRRRWSSARP